MKKIVFLILLSCTLMQVNAQDKPAKPAQQKSNKEVNKPNMRDRLNDLTKVDIRERLVQLAMQNPVLEVADANIQNAEYGIQKSKSEWLNTVTMQGNLNEFSIKNNTQGAFYPKYNFGISVPLGLFGTASNNVKIAKTNMKIAVAQKNDKYRDVRAEVLSKYEDYLLRIQLLELQTQLVSDEYSNYITAQEKYKTNDIKEEDFNKAYRNYNTELARQKTMERDVKVAIIELEKLIGTELEPILAEYRRK